MKITVKTFVIAIVWLLSGMAVSTFGKPCECKDMDKIKAEILRTSTGEAAWKEIFGWARGTLEGVKPPVSDDESYLKSNDELNTKFLQLARAPRSEWRRIMREPIDQLQKPEKAGGLDQNGEPIVNDAFQEANCDGIVEGVRIHERTHREFYTSPLNIAGGSALTWRLIRTRAESEVESYRAQTIYLEALLASLELRCDGELVYQAEIILNMQPMLVVKIISNARISFKVDDSKRITGGGTQTLTLEPLASSACTATSLKAEYEWIVSGQEEGEFLQFKFSPKGAATIPGIQMTCKIGNEQGHGMSLPTPFGIGDVRMEKKDGATREIDISRMSGGRATGKAVTTLYLYKK